MAKNKFSGKPEVSEISPANSTNSRPHPTNVCR